MLFVEVLHADGGVEDGNVSEAENYADSAHSIMHMRLVQAARLIFVFQRI